MGKLNAQEKLSNALQQKERTLEQEMGDAAADLRFEYAARLRDEIREVERELRDLAEAN